MHRKLNETRDKITEIENKVSSRRVSASFRQILADAKLNRSMALSPLQESIVKSSTLPPLEESPARMSSSSLFEESLVKASPHSSAQPPLKQARMFNQSVNSPRYNAVPTAIQKTPQPSTRKSHPASALQILSASRQKDSTKMSSTPTRHVIATPTLRQIVTPQLASVQRRNVASSVLKAVTTPAVVDHPVQQHSEMNPMHGPVPLKSIEHIKWAQKLKFDPKWLDAERVPQWNPLPDDYFNQNGDLEKDELRRKAGMSYEFVKRTYWLVFRKDFGPNNQQV